MLRFTTFLALFFCFYILPAQEICNNAIDDDADGLIDLNDDDCTCNALVPSSLIPNPSFEEMTCCPDANAELNCAIAWIQASAPTTDYVHTCAGYLGNTNINPPAVAPLPFPDGQGGVGFRDGQGMVGSNYKEYVGACLTAAMEVGVDYRFDFYVGFRAGAAGSTSLKMAIFATTNCNDLPFGGNSTNVGCPTNSTGSFVQLGEISVSGEDEWVNVVFDFVADQAYTAIVLGPSCSINPNWLQSPYFYLDRLALEETEKFGVPFASVTGSICENNLVLALDADPQNAYQWYLDGIALIGETNPTLLLTASGNVEGNYLGIITTPDGCYTSQEYKLRIPPYYGAETRTICENDSYIFYTDTLRHAGNFVQTVQALDGCDSIITLTLIVLETSTATLLDTFCLGETYTYLNFSSEEAGTFETIIPNKAGCDSTITLILTTLGLGDGILLADSLYAKLGEVLQIEPLFYDPIYTTFEWTDASGTVLSSSVEIAQYLATQSTILHLEATDTYGCGANEYLPLQVRANYEMYIPNVFNPNAALDNQYFRFYAPISLDKVLSFQVYDRWGSLVFEDTDIDKDFQYIGWDGQIKGKTAATGVYAWIIKARFLDGQERVFVGDVTLLR